MCIYNAILLADVKHLTSINLALDANCLEGTMSYPYIYKHEGKRVWINTGGLNAVSIEFRVVSCSGKELTLRLLHEPDCQCTR
jgi:hypothetical protein